MATTTKLHKHVLTVFCYTIQVCRFFRHFHLLLGSPECQYVFSHARRINSARKIPRISKKNLKTSVDIKPRPKRFTKLRQLTVKTSRTARDVLQDGGKRVSHFLYIFSFQKLQSVVFPRLLQTICATASALQHTIALAAPIKPCGRSKRATGALFVPGQSRIRVREPSRVRDEESNIATVQSATKTKINHTLH